MRDLADELLQAKVKAQLFGTAPEVTLGRLVLVERIGSGAMGTVFAAHDPKLDRKVAVKVLHSSRTELLAEARALAKLAHPNVVAVHDVVEHEGGVHIIMELAPGVSLRRWLETPRPRREILRVLREAGAGIAAAHRAGLVHRDIKPDNILVGDDRTRVVDFGLAATASDGTSAGTPSYMAPELLAGNPATIASDQFSFAVVLYEALHGARPYAGKTREELERAASAAASAPMTHLRRVLSRALSADPAARFPSMDALLAALSHRRRTNIYLIASLALLAGIAGGALAFRHHAPDPCTAGAERRTAAWNPSISSRVRSSLGDTPWTATTLAHLSDSAAHWQSTFESVCHARGQISDTRFDLRMRCLDRALDRFSSLVAELGQGSGTTCATCRTQVAQVAPDPTAATAVADLPDASVCATLTDAGELSLPTDHAQRALAIAAERAIDRGWALVSLARYSAAATSAASARTQLASLSPADAPGPHAELLALEASVLSRTSSGDAARAKTQEALTAAAAAHAPLLELDLWSRTLRGELFAGDPKRVLEWAAFARAAAARAGRQGAELDGIIAEAERSAGHLAAAKQLLDRALASTDPLRPDQRAVLELNLAGVQLAAGDSLAARKTLERALARVQSSLGDGHPELALYLDKLAVAHRARGEIRDALKLHDQSLALRTSAFGEADRAVATSLFHRGQTLLEAGELTRALHDLESAADIRRKVYGETSSRLGEIVLALADHWTAKGVAAVGLYEHAAELDPRLDLVAHAPANIRAQSNLLSRLEVPPLGADELLSIERARAIAAHVHDLTSGRNDDGTVANLDQARSIAVALRARLPANADAALVVPLGQALLDIGDHDEAAKMFDIALSAAGSQPTRTGLAAAIGFARSTTGERAKQAARVAISLYQAMPELARGDEYAEMQSLAGL